MKWYEDEEVRAAVSEGVHTAFRKGSDSAHAHIAHEAVTAMGPEAWGSVIGYLLYGLHLSGYEIRRKG